ncbi:hypothetical protein OG306_40415 (plasmid) [Streptomyces sp. NBC_01241]|uniref:DUF6372 family protein n=1 Tax=Streptomyces TaxID=1883 RepID=UPI00352F106C|nr:hypothetical protein OG306_40415 [Streptomyces sp. NBC_01241]
MTGESDSPVLTIRMRWMFGWEQHRPGGCRCLCRMFHNIPGTGVCLAAAEPGLLIRVVTATQSDGPLTVCRDCYTALAPLAD